MLNTIQERKTLQQTCNNSVVEYHSVPRINLGSFRGPRKERRGSFQGRNHFRVELGIISGFGIISGAVNFLSFSFSIPVKSPLRYKPPHYKPPQKH